MTAHVGPGAVRVDGTVEVFDGSVWRVMPATATPLQAAITALLATNPQPCDVCGRYDCQCSAPDPDPHGDLAGFSNEDLPY
jgi:hypothetical protein